MAYMDIPRKVRPWKRLGGLGAIDTRTTELSRTAANYDSMAKSLDEQSAKASSPAQAASLQSQAQKYRDGAVAARQEAQRLSQTVKPSSVPPTSPLPKAPSSTGGSTGKASAWSLPGAKEAAMKGAADARASGGIVSVDSGSSGGFLQSIAEVLGIAAPVGERIVKSIQDDRAATVKMRADRAEALRMSAMSPAERSAAQGSSMPSGSTIATVVGGIAAVGVVIVGLKWLAGAPAAAK